MKPVRNRCGLRTIGHTVLAVGLITNGPVWAAVRVTITYDTIWHLSPTGQTQGDDAMTFVFDGHTVVSEVQSNHNQARASMVGSRVRRRDSNGLEYDSEFHIRDNHIFLVSVYADHSIITNVQINGPNCIAKREFRLKPGRPFAIDRSYTTGAPIPILGKTYTNIACSIAPE